MNQRFAAKLPVLLVLVVLLGIFIPSVSYALKDDNNKISLTNSDKKKLDKADGIFAKADNSTKEADNIYADIANRQSELTAEESDKLNNKALEKQIEALKIKKEAEEIRYALYLSKCVEFEKKYTGSPDVISYANSTETEGKIKYQSALEQYKDAFGTEDKLMSYSKMITASELMVLAVSNMKQAFETFSTIAFDQQSAPVQVPESKPADSIPVVVDSASIVVPPAPILTPESVSTSPVIDSVSMNSSNLPASTPVPVIQPDSVSQTTTMPTPPSEPVTSVASTDTSSVQLPPVQPLSNTDSSKVIEPKPSELPAGQANLYQAVQINESMIDMFNKFLQRSYPDKYENYVMNFGSLNFADVSSIKDAWYKYLYAGSVDEVAVNDTAKSFAVDSVCGIAADSLKIVADNTTVEPNTSIDQPSSNKNNSNSRKPKKRAAQSFLADPSQTKGFVFRLQIAASRVPLNSEMLHEVYSGVDNFQVEEKLENEWYKYSIGPYSTYQEAMDLRDVVNVKGAFVVAFVNGRKINSNEALVKPEHNSTSFTNFNTNGNVVFKVQVAASHEELSVDKLNSIFQSSIPLEKTFEDGWHKYMINCENSYKKACYTIKTINVQGAFIAVYKDGVRINIKDLKKQNE